jgi:TRAP-type C4-dicarboxylate transport system substrate-binding protein
MSVEVNMNTWKKIPPHLQQIMEAAVKWHSWNQYVAIQKADLEAFELFQKKQGVTIIRLKDSDIEKFKKFAPALWVTWAKKHPLALKAFKSQWEYIKSIKIGYFSDKDMVDTQGKKLDF